VSHDRHLIKTVADSLWVVDGGKLEVFDGDLDDYQRSLASRDELPRRPPKAAAKGAAASEPKRSRVGRLRREFEQIEKGIIAIEAERTLIEAELCKDPKHAGLQARHAALFRDAAFMESRWMEVGTAIEEAEAADAQSRH
jgi:ATP-binding cassette subfamily F protein 3